MTDHRRVVLVVPIAPARGGNGLAMRAGVLLEALAEQAIVDVFVVPVSGPASSDLEWAHQHARSIRVARPVSDTRARDHVIAQVADRRLRKRLEQTAPLPGRAAAAPPTLASDVVDAFGREPSTVVVGMRAYLAPLACGLATRLGAARLVIDLDEDDSTLLRELGYADEADAFERLGRAWLPDADALLLASSVDAAAIARRYALHDVHVVPNAIRPTAVAPLPAEGAGLLFVGNLTYEPNIQAIAELVDEVLPAVRAGRPDVNVDLVGPSLVAERQRFASVAGVRVTGQVPDVAPFYERAALVVLPLRHGGGTRIKVLEAFAYRRPVIATPAAVTGLDVRDGKDVVIADTPSAMSDAVLALLDDPGRAAAIAARAHRTLSDHYVPEVVGPVLRSIVLGSPTP
jgi:glycosyltransferase involved in cell wall biosynthesis